MGRKEHYPAGFLTWPLDESFASVSINLFEVSCPLSATDRNLAGSFRTDIAHKTEVNVMQIASGDRAT